MSKIKIPLDNMRYALHDLLHEHLDEVYELAKTCRKGSRHTRGSYDWSDDDEVLWLMQQGVIFPGMEADMANYYDEDDYDDYEEVDDNGECVWPPTKESHKRGKLDPYGSYWDKVDALKKKKHKKGNSRKSKIIDINVPYSGEEESPNEESDSYDEVDSKMIYYYPNYNIKDDRYEFTSLKEFDDFCQECGFHVSPTVAEEIAYRSVSHVCLSPLSREHGLLEIIGEESFAEMMYEAAQECGEFYG